MNRMATHKSAASQVMHSLGEPHKVQREVSGQNALQAVAWLRVNTH